MDIYGPSCERLVRGALEGPAAGPLLVGRHRFRLRQVAILKEPGGLAVDGGRRRHLSLHRGPFVVRRLRYEARLAGDGRMVELAVSDLAIDAALGRWLVAEGPLGHLASAGKAGLCWPSDAPLGLVDALPGWRGEAAFLLANVLVCACRRYFAPRPQADGGLIPEAGTAAIAAAPAPASEPMRAVPRRVAGAVHLAG